MSLLSDFGEDHWIERLIKPIAKGIGDDCAFVEELAVLISTDAFEEGVHFTRDMRADWVGHKLVRATLSDVFASGGRPRWMTMSLSAPANLDQSWLTSLTHGVGQCLETFKVDLVGGDLTRSQSHIAIAATALGPLIGDRPITRSGAQDGDLVAVTGRLGESALALKCLLDQRSPRSASENPELHFKRPLAADFVEQAASRPLLHAMMDLSDGLTTDLPRLCQASSCGAIVDLDQLPIPTNSQANVIELLWHGGEDYELLMTFAPENLSEIAAVAKASKTPLTVIGHITHDPNLVYRHNGQPYQFASAPWQHF